MSRSEYREVSYVQYSITPVPPETFADVQRFNVYTANSSHTAGDSRLRFFGYMWIIPVNTVF